MPKSFPDNIRFEFLHLLGERSPEWFIDLGPGDHGSEAWVARQIWHEVRVLGLEPAPERYRRCLDQRFPGTLLQLAAWSHNEVGLPLYADRARETWGMFPLDEEARSTDVVVGRALDELDEELGPFAPCVIWADVEGSELRMLQGASRLFGSGSVLALNLALRRESQTGAWIFNDDLDDLLETYGYVAVREEAKQLRGHCQDLIYVHADDQKHTTRIKRAP